MRIWYAIATHLKDHAGVTWGADDYGDQGVTNENVLECRASIGQQCDSCHLGNFLDDESRFGRAHGNPGSWHPFF